MSLIGWYSQKSYEYSKCVYVYKTEEGKEVRCTEILKLNKKSSHSDAICLGPVRNFIRKNDYSNSNLEISFSVISDYSNKRKRKTACQRCGRENHHISDCSGLIDINGEKITDEEWTQLPTFTPAEEENSKSSN